MAISKKFSENDYNRFEADLLHVLKAEPDHKLAFDGKMAFRSRRYDCLLAATDVFWDEKSGDIVLVGAFKSGSPVYDETKSYPVMKTRVAVPLKECFDDLRVSSGQELRLLGKARKAVIDRYVGGLLNTLESKGIVDAGVLNLDNLGLGPFKVPWAKVDSVMRDDDGKIALVCSNSYFNGVLYPLSGVSLVDIQNFGHELERVVEAYKDYPDIVKPEVGLPEDGRESSCPEKELPSKQDLVRQPWWKRLLRDRFR